MKFLNKKLFIFGGVVGFSLLGIHFWKNKQNQVQVQSKDEIILGSSTSETFNSKGDFYEPQYKRNGEVVVINASPHNIQFKGLYRSLNSEDPRAIQTPFFNNTITAKTRTSFSIKALHNPFFKITVNGSTYIIVPNYPEIDRTFQNFETNDSIKIVISIEEYQSQILFGVTATNTKNENNVLTFDNIAVKV